MQSAEGEADDDKALHGDEADGEGRRLAGQQRHEARHLAANAVLPGNVLPQVPTHVHPVSHPDYRQVHAHQKIGHTKLRDKHVKPQLPHAGMKTETIDEASQVPQESQHSENGENDTVQVRPQQVVTRRDFVGRSQAVFEVEASRQNVLAAELGVVRVHQLQRLHAAQNVWWNLNDTAAAHV